MLASLPQEIHDEVLSYLQDDKASLRSCSLACRAWLPRARYHLFRDISLDPSPLTLRFKDLSKGNPAIPPLVREIELRGKAPASKAWWEGGGSSGLLWPTLGPGNGNLHNTPSRRESDVLEIVSWLRDVFGSQEGAQALHLPKVHALRLVEFTFDSTTTSLLSEFFPRVDSLSLNGCRAMSFTNLVELLCSFPLLHTLHLSSLEWLPPRPGDELPAFTGHPPFELTHLRLSRDVHVEPVIEWFLKMSIHKTIRSLQCSVTSIPSATALRGLFQASGFHLNKLWITLSESRDPTALLTSAQFNLSACTNLHTLHISCSPSKSIPAHRSLSWVLMLLSQVRSSHLRELRLSIRSAQLPWLNLGGLDVVLAQNCYDSLRQLAIQVDMSGDADARREELETTLKERLPTADAHGIMRIEYGS